MPKNICIYSGSANPKLSSEIADYLGVPLGKVNLSRFPDGEIFCQYAENVRRADVFIIQPTCSPTNEHLMELLIMLDAAKRASAARITAVLPYYGYARQDRKDRPRVPITAKLVANLITVAALMIPRSRSVRFSPVTSGAIRLRSSSGSVASNRRSDSCSSFL